MPPDAGCPELRFVILAGPTGAGKTDLAVRIAQAHEAEIVGADAFQVYRGLDLLSAKPSQAQRQCVTHHLIGTVPLTCRYDAFRYGQEARAAIAALNRAGKVPLVVGGTGFYLEALTSRLPDLPPPDLVLRARLGALDPETLVAQLQSLDPEGFARIDLRNPRRVRRAVEICLQTGRPFSQYRVVPETRPPSFTLAWSRPELWARIDRRVEAMFAQGVVEEVAGAGPIGPTAATMIGLEPIRKLLDGESSREECIREVQLQTRRYAKRQETWFRSRSFAAVSPEKAVRAVGQALDELALRR